MKKMASSKQSQYSLLSMFLTMQMSIGPSLTHFSTPQVFYYISKLLVCQIFFCQIFFKLSFWADVTQNYYTAATFSPAVLVRYTFQFCVRVRFKDADFISCPSPSSDFLGKQMAPRQIQWCFSKDASYKWPGNQNPRSCPRR